MRISTALVVAMMCIAPLCTRADVTVEGVTDAQRSNILAHMRLDDEACDQDPVKVRYRYSGAAANIRAALRPFGYYDVRVESEFEQPEDGCWRAVFRVDPGSPVLIQQARIEVRGEGSEMDAFQKLVHPEALQTGRQLDHGAYENTKSRLVVTARELGFFDASLTTSTMQVDPSKLTATIDLVLDTGPRYRFGELYITGDILDERLLRRYVDFQQGQPFEQRKIRKLHNDLLQADYFSSVDIRTDTRDDNIADVIVLLEAGRQVRYGIGAGFGTDTGPVLRGDIVNRRFNRRGHRLEVDAELSQVRQNTTLDYRIPGKRPQNDWYSLYSGLNREDTDAVESIGWKIGVRENKFLTINWTSTPFAEFVIERFRQDGDWGEKLSLVPGWGLKYLAADEPSRPTRGLRMAAEVAVASREVVSDASFLRLHLGSKVILPISRRGRILVRGDLGWMATDDFDKVPPSWRFFAGGDRSVRGYDYQSLGPVDAEGKSIGGRRMLTASVEGDWRVRERWSGALFADAGNVGERNLLSDLPWSVGFGARWYSPVGPIRLDLAFAEAKFQDFRVHISMGPDL